MFGYLFVVLMVFNLGMWSGDVLFESLFYVVLVDLSGLIMVDSEVSVDCLVKGIWDVFEVENSRGVIICVNSLGGSLV